MAAEPLTDEVGDLKIHWTGRKVVMRWYNPKRAKQEIPCQFLDIYAVNVVKNSKCGNLARKKVMIRIAPNAAPLNQKNIRIAFADTGNRLMVAVAQNHNILDLEAGLRIRRL